jgi:hypothetical protein
MKMQLKDLNPSGGSRVIAYGRTDRQTYKHDETNSRNFANVPTNTLIERCNDQ